MSYLSEAYVVSMINYMNAEELVRREYLNSFKILISINFDLYTKKFETYCWYKYADLHRPSLLIYKNHFW